MPFPLYPVEVGQQWTASDGSGHVVTVFRVVDGWVSYSWLQGGKEISNEKDAFSFKCRYHRIEEEPPCPAT